MGASSSFTQTGQVIEQGTGAPIANAKVRINSPNFNFQTTADAAGNFSIPSVYADAYDVIASKWGYEGAISI